MLLPNIPEIVYYFYACWILGVTVSPIDPRTSPMNIIRIIKNTNAKLLVVILDKYAEKVSPILGEIGVEKIVVVSPTDSMGNSLKEKVGKGLYKAKEFYLNMADKDFAGSKIVMNRKFINHKKIGNRSPVFYETELGLPAANLFTSGTEGSPKTALHSHQAYNVKAKQIQFALPKAVPGDKFLGIMPFFTGYGSFQGMHSCLFRGVNIDLIPQFKASQFPELIFTHHPSVAMGVPNYWHDFRNQLDSLIEKYGIESIKSLKYAISGGDKQSYADVKELTEVLHKHCPDCIFIRGYGSTEVGGGAVITVADETYEDYEYVGIPMPGVKYIIDRKEDEEKGELLVSDPSLMIGYLNNEEETARAIVTIGGDRYMRMGDYFTSDELDRLYFQGRKKRAIIRPDGHTVHSLPIEETIQLVDCVDSCCAVGLKKKDGSSGEIPTAFVVLKENVSATQEMADSIDEFCLKYLSERDRALAYVFVESIPMTLMAKNDFSSLQKTCIEDLPYYSVDYDVLKSANPKEMSKRQIYN